MTRARLNIKFVTKSTFKYCGIILLIVSAFSISISVAQNNTYKFFNKGLNYNNELLTSVDTKSSSNVFLKADNINSIPIVYKKTNSLKSVTDHDYEFYPDSVTISSIIINSRKLYYDYEFSGQSLVSENILVKSIDNNSWVNNMYETVNFNESGNISEILWKTWESEDWVNSGKETFVYDENNNLISDITEMWNDNVWEYQQKITYEFTPDGKMTNSLYQIWNNGIWINLTKNIYSYDDSGNNIIQMFYTWDDTVWRENQKYTNEFDENRNLTKRIYESWVDGEWKNMTKTTYDYTPTNKVKKIVSNIWEDSLWVKQSKTVFVYNDLDFVSSYTTQNWANDDWEDYEKVTFSYGDYGVTESQLIQIAVGKEWADYSLKQYTYDEYGNAIEGKYFINENGDWTQNLDGVLKMIYNYGLESLYLFGYEFNTSYKSIVVGLQTNKTDNTGFYIYPNPVKDVLFINNSYTNGNYDVTLTDISGKILYEKQKSGNLEKINLSDYADGLYILTVKYGNKTLKKKIIKNH